MHRWWQSFASVCICDGDGYKYAFLGRPGRSSQNRALTIYSRTFSLIYTYCRFLELEEKLRVKASADRYTNISLTPPLLCRLPRFFRNLQSWRMMPRLLDHKMQYQADIILFQKTSEGCLLEAESLLWTKQQQLQSLAGLEAV